ncbi:hypothetical protein KSP40_PGU000737 [Platanthera guangdongensis]|uniref:Uncharacterized protein n=1 Tax=Platanthera guangdongensis TaxID=2320717 RepID=A0ABR2MKC4_9ASPA
MATPFGGSPKTEQFSEATVKIEFFLSAAGLQMDGALESNVDQGREGFRSKRNVEHYESGGPGPFLQTNSLKPSPFASSTPVMVRKHGLEISQPDMDPSRGLPWRMTERRTDREVHN